MMDQKNLFLAIILSLAILLGFQFLFAGPEQEQRRLEQQQETSELPVPNGAPGAAPDVPLGADAVAQSRDKILDTAARLPITTPSLSGSINLADGRIDDLVLTKFRETIEPDSDNIVFFSPSGSENPYFAEFGWVDGNDGVFGAAGTNWRTRQDELTSNRPLVMEATLDNGLRLIRTVAVDEDYMFTVTQQVVNESDEMVRLSPFGRITRLNTPDTLGFFILHEGPIGVFGGKLQEKKYDDLRDDGRISHEQTNGWIGITDKYWLAAVIPDHSAVYDMKFKHDLLNNVDVYQADYLGGEQTIRPGGSVEIVNNFFAGAKQVAILDRYQEDMNIDLFDRAIDFGWFFFLTKPFLTLLIFFAKTFNNFGLSILFVTVIIKLVFFPLANKSYKSMSRMKALQPKMQELRERFGEDRQKMQQETMALYKREKVNPVSGCLPMVIQIPVFFSLYKVLFVSIEMRQAPFFGWITDLSVRDPTNVFNLFGLIPWGAPTFLALGAWPLIMGVTMFLQQKLNPQPPDPVQAKIFLMMPVIFTIFLARFPAGLVIYWAWNNLLSIAQQYLIMRSMGVSIGGKKATST